jgi:branched-chain amino acid transport system ATP-binding protein
LSRGDGELLEVKGIVKHFTGLVALNGVDFAIRPGELLGLIGPNGAGKSVMVNIITGLYPPTAGAVFYRGENITGLRPDLIARKGISRTFQLSTLFFDLSVFDNIALGVRATAEVGLWEAILRTRSNREKDQRIQAQAERIIQILHLERQAHEWARNLPYGLQKVVAIGIALAGDPELLILDEPLTGLITSEAEEVMARIDGLHKQGLTVMIIEHNMRAVMGHCNRIVVLSFGNKIAEGTPEEIRRNRDVIRSYLGES